MKSQIEIKHVGIDTLALRNVERANNRLDISNFECNCAFYKYYDFKYARRSSPVLETV
jgi:hypothetical protein